MGVSDILLFIAPLSEFGQHLSKFLYIFLYLGPETILPLGSLIAAIIGFLLIFWRFIASFFRKLFYKITGRAIEETSIEEGEEEINDHIQS